MTRSQATPTSSQSITMERMISELTDTISDLQAKVELLEQIETNLAELHNVALAEVDRLKVELQKYADRESNLTSELCDAKDLVNSLEAALEEHQRGGTMIAVENVALKVELAEAVRKQGFCFACGEGLGS